MGMLSSFLHPERGYAKGQEQLDQYYNNAQDLLRPYQNQGQEAYGHLNTAMQRLLNPAELHGDFANSYQESPMARIAAERAQNSGLRAASSMGMMGSTPALQAIQSGGAAIGAQDQERYIDRMIQQYLQGAGLAQGIYGQGANMAGQMGQNAMNMGQNSAEMAYGKQNAPGQLFGNILGTAVGVAAPWTAFGNSNNLGGAHSLGGGLDRR